MTSERASREEQRASGVEASPPAEPPSAREPEDAAMAGQGAPPPLPGAGTPEGERLADAHHAFEVGDYARVRAVCGPLREARLEAVARAARDLDARTRVDPVQVAVLCACLLFFLGIAYVYVIR